MKAPKAIHVNFSFHPELCVGCGACVGACLDENDNLPIERPLLRSLHRVEQARKNGANLLWYSLACLHCDSHDCWDACPKGCFSLDAATGTVQLDNTNCIGCHACEMACRYQAVVFEADGKANKCDGCLERLRSGRLPRCVEACPRHAITIDDRPTVRTSALKKLEKDLLAKKFHV